VLAQLVNQLQLESGSVFFVVLDNVQQAFVLRELLPNFKFAVLNGDIDQIPGGHGLFLLRIHELNHRQLFGFRLHVGVARNGIIIVVGSNFAFGVEPQIPASEHIPHIVFARTIRPRLVSFGWDEFPEGVVVRGGLTLIDFFTLSKFLDDGVQLCEGAMDYAFVISFVLRVLEIDEVVWFDQLGLAATLIVLVQDQFPEAFVFILVHHIGSRQHGRLDFGPVWIRL
jgi:hypothetical protein